MTTDLNQVFDGYPIPVAEDHFTEPQTPPFVAWENPSTSNVFADNQVWMKSENYEVSLYTRQNTKAEEERLETWLSNHGLCWEKESKVWDEKEQVYWSSYYVG